MTVQEHFWVAPIVKKTKKCCMLNTQESTHAKSKYYQKQGEKRDKSLE